MAPPLNPPLWRSEEVDRVDLETVVLSHSSSRKVCCNWLVFTLHLKIQTILIWDDNAKSTKFGKLLPAPLIRNQLGPHAGKVKVHGHTESDLRRFQAF